MFEDDCTEDQICEFVLDGEVEGRLDSILNESQHEVVSNFLKFDPMQRWSANDALEHAVFKSDPCTTTTNA